MACGYIKLLTVLSVTIQLTLSAKTNSRPVYEVINEQPKAEEKLIKTSAVANLPYGNPLAGNSQQNAKLHAHNQQAMFNAERIRQHKAQLQQQQRWLKTPQVVHNYMRAYHELQENHQLAIEKEQAINDDTTLPRESKRPTKDQKDITKLEAVKSERKRKHRSHGSVDYQTLYISNQGLKPNIINEMAYKSNSDFIYPQYPSQSYQSVQDIETLNSLLNKNPNEQLNEFNALINVPKLHVNHDKELETPIDLYFHLKGPSEFTLPVHYDTRYAQIPIKEPETQYTRQTEPRHIEPVTNIQDVNTELTNQINVGYNPLYQEEFKKKVEEPRYQANYIPIYKSNEEETEELNNRERIHHNQGIQHLTKDGAGVSPYDENVSMNIDNLRLKRSVLDTTPFLLHNETNPVTKDEISINSTELPKQESLLRIDINSKRRRESFGTFLTTPNFSIGESIDYSDNDYEYQVPRRPNHNYGEPEYDQDYDDAIDYEFENQNKQTIQRHNQYDTFQTYAPSESYTDFKGNYGNFRPVKRFPDVSTTIGPIYSSNLAFSPYIHQSYGLPYTHSQNKFNLPLHLPEPVYLLTQTQLSKLVGHHNLNIEHLDLFHLSKDKRNHYPRKYKKRPHNRDLNYASSYEFGYRVHDMHSGNEFGHQEEKRGEETNGQYHVLLPDGKMQNVRYSAGPEGFHADISYDGRK